MTIHRLSVVAVATGLPLYGAAAANLIPLTVLGRVYLLPLAFCLGALGCMIAPLPTLGLLVTIGAIKLDTLLPLPDGLDWTMPLACALGVGLTIRLLTEEDPRPYPRTPALLAAIFASLWLVSTWWSASPLYGSVKAVVFVAVTGVVAAGPAIYLRHERHWWWYFGTVMAVALLVGVELLRHAADEDSTRSAFGGSYLGSARVIGLGMLIAITTVIIRPGLGLWTPVATAGCVLGLVAMLKSGARGPLLSLGLTLLALAIASWRTPSSASRRRLRWLALCLPFAAGLALAWFPERFETMLVRGALLVTMHGDSIESRIERIGLARALWEATPLLGSGAGSFNWAFGWGDKLRGAYPHNLALETLAETGLLGLVCLLGLLLWAGHSIWRLSASPAAHPWIIPVAGLFCYSLLNAMVSGDLNTNRGVFASLGLLVALHRRTASSPGSSPHATHLPH